MHKVSRASHLNLPSLATILFAAFLLLLGSGAMAPAWALGPDDTNCEAGNVVVSPTTDGPADLPTHCVNTSLANTPSPGAVICKRRSNTRPQHAAGAGCCGGGKLGRRILVSRYSGLRG
jgi:hypothetical protein